MANIPFTEFEFVATGAPTARTMPDRLAEVKNVMDFGATGDGTTNDRDAIQAAINWTAGADRGVIYFPPAPGGEYQLNSALDLSYDGPLSIVFQGSGLSSRINSTFNGFQFERTLGSPENTANILFEKMYMTNSHATGGNCRIGSSKKVAFRDCQFGAHTSYTAENTDGGLASSNTYITSCVFAGAGTVAGSIGIIIAGGVIEGTDVRGYDVGYRIGGSGTTIWGGKSERCNTCMEFGVGNASEARGAATDIGAQGVAVIAHTLEGHWTALHFVGTTEGFFGSGLYLLGHNQASFNSGVTGGVDGSNYGIFISSDKLKAALFTGITIAETYETAGIVLEDPTSRPFITFQGILFSGNGPGVEWDVSGLAMAARYINCQYIGTNAVYEFDNLPSGSDVYEGDEYDISDSDTVTWGATPAGGSTNNVRVRWNGSAWTVVGK